MFSPFGRVVAVFAMFAIGAVAPAKAATPEEAQALADKAAALISAEGEKAFAAIGDPQGEFRRGDLYVTVFDHQGVILVHPKLVGINTWESEDPDGVKYTQVQVKLAETSGTGWVNYKFINPLTKKIEPKKTWVHNVGKFIVSCGVYVTP